MLLAKVCSKDVFAERGDHRRLYINQASSCVACAQNGGAPLRGKNSSSVIIIYQIKRTSMPTLASYAASLANLVPGQLQVIMFLFDLLP